MRLEDNTVVWLHLLNSSYERMQNVGPDNCVHRSYSLVFGFIGSALVILEIEAASSIIGVIEPSVSHVLCL